MADHRERNEKIQALIGSGLSPTEVAKQFGLSKSRIAVLCPTGVLRPQLSDQERDQIVILAMSGLTTLEISKWTGRSRDTIRRFSRKAGVQVRNGNDHVGPDKRAQAVALVRQGLSYGRVAQKLGISRNVVAGAVKRAKGEGDHDGVSRVSELQRQSGDGQSRHRSRQLHPAPTRL
jgi:transposase